MEAGKLKCSYALFPQKQIRLMSMAGGNRGGRYGGCWRSMGPGFIIGGRKVWDLGEDNA